VPEHRRTPKRKQQIMRGRGGHVFVRRCCAAINLNDSTRQFFENRVSSGNVGRLIVLQIASRD
jgi:hypothetical protein